MQARKLQPDRATEAGPRATKPGRAGSRSSLLDLQRSAGNRAVVRALAVPSHAVSSNPLGTGVVQRWGGYYLVCERTDPGAALIENDTVVPARYYRTVDKKPESAVKAPSQPFSFWTLYEVPKPVTPVTPIAQVKPQAAAKAVAEDEADEDPMAEEDLSEKKGPPAKGSSPGNEGSKKKVATPTKKKKKTDITGQTTPTAKQASATEASPDKLQKPGEELWKTELRQVAKKQGWTKEGVEVQIKGCEDGLRDRSAALEKSLTELSGVWATRTGDRRARTLT